MKKIIVILIFITGVSCNNDNSTSTGTDSANTSAPSIIKDSGTQHPTGVTSDGVISTDTAAFGVNANRKDTSHQK
jgi:hypothetical protein